MKGHISTILQLCKKDISDNVYVKERILASMESTNILQEGDDKNISLEEEVCEEDDKSLSLGMPMQPQGEDNEEQEDDENDEQLENDERKHPPSPPMDEGNTQDFADDKLCFYDSKNEIGRAHV